MASPMKKDIELTTLRNQVEVKVNNYDALGFEEVPEVSCDDSQPVVIGSSIIGIIKGVTFVNCKAIVTHVKLLELLPVFTSRGLSIWQASTRLA